MSRRYVDQVWIRDHMNRTDARFADKARKDFPQRCARQDGHPGSHLWIRSSLPPLKGECAALPERVTS